MAESATKGLKSLGLNDRDAAIRKKRCISEISVEGFETCSLQKYALELVLRKVFASCGNVLNPSIIKSVAFMRIEGEYAQEKALALDGTDMGGWCAIVKAAAWQDEPFVDLSERIKTCSMSVEGYDTGLPKIDIQIALCKHFSSCGEVSEVTVLKSGVSYIEIGGERCLHKALKLSGRDVGGMNLQVEIDTYIDLRENVGRRRRFYRQPTGPGQRPSEEQKRFAEKMEKEMEKKFEEKKNRIKKIKMEVMEEEMKEMEMMKVMEKKALDLPLGSF